MMNQKDFKEVEALLEKVADLEEELAAMREDAEKWRAITHSASLQQAEPVAYVGWGGEGKPKTLLLKADLPVGTSLYAKPIASPVALTDAQRGAIRHATTVLKHYSMAPDSINAVSAGILIDLLAASSVAMTDAQTRAQLESLARHSYGGRFPVYMSGDDARALLAQSAPRADHSEDARLMVANCVPAGWKIGPDEEGWSVVSPSGDGCYLFDNDRLHGQTMEGAAIREVLRQLCSSLVYPDAAPSASASASSMPSWPTDDDAYFVKTLQVIRDYGKPTASPADGEEDAYVIDRLGKLLAGVAIALKGPDLAQHRHSYHDLVEVAEKMALELDLYRTMYGEKAPAEASASPAALTEFREQVRRNLPEDQIRRGRMLDVLNAELLKVGLNLPDDTLHSIIYAIEASGPSTALTDEQIIAIYQDHYTDEPGDAEPTHILPFARHLLAASPDKPQKHRYGPYDVAFMGAGVWAGIPGELPSELVGHKVWITKAGHNAGKKLQRDGSLAAPQPSGERE